MQSDHSTNTALERKPGCDCWVTADCQFCYLHRRSVDLAERRIVEWLRGTVVIDGRETRVHPGVADAIERGAHRA